MHEHEHKSRGKSTFGLVDAGIVFKELNIKPGDTFLDLGCGPGSYALAASELAGNTGTVYAIDEWKESIDNLTQEAAGKGLENIQTAVSDICNPFPIQDQSVDICLLSTVLHEVNIQKTAKLIFPEIQRVLKPIGCLAIIEFKKIDTPLGPPVKIRLSPEEVELITVPYGFVKSRVIDIGPHNYLILLKKE